MGSGACFVRAVFNGLYYYRARYYDPAVGRFVGEDPTTFAAGINFYTYVTNNPANLVDPLGLWELGPKLKKCLEDIFKKPVGGVKIQTVSPHWQRFFLAETGKDLIRISIPCTQFLADSEMLLEEYYHVLEQWNTGRLNHLKYLWDSRHGYEKNPFEIEAKKFASDHVEELQKCRSCEK